MATPHAQIGQQALVVLDVALRVPCIFISDAIFNSYNDPTWSGWAGAAGGIISVLGILVSSVVLVLSQRALFKFYTLCFGALLGLIAISVNYYATSHMDFHSLHYSAVLEFELSPQNGPTLCLGIAVVQLLFGFGYVMLLNVQSMFAVLIIMNIMAPMWALAIKLPEHVRQAVVVASGFVVAISMVMHLTLKFKWFCYSCRYVFVLVWHMYNIYGMQVLVEDTWKRIRFPDVLRVFWLTRMITQAIILINVVLVVRNEKGDQSNLTCDVLWDLFSNLVTSGCDSTLMVLGMSAVISSISHYLGLGILAFIGSSEEQDKRLGFVAPVLFFILALQSGLSALDPQERLVRLSRNMCLLLTAILHFIHGMTDPVLMSLSASHILSFRRHFPVLLVSLCLFVLPMVLSYILWHHYTLNTWLFAVTAFCVELCLKVIISSLSTRCSWWMATTASCGRGWMTMCTLCVPQAMSLSLSSA
ncbi:hypothetical protein ANANG_G00014550 [Anguilla anguilla]|uniref:TRC8-like N-terminal domain-containing protein n=1 Tax=Anguilla anguilla TaxID=7936 RepID=A0A9D3MXF7_ANGAN|nr:hypothetical protein ANANG_G00014550 [Anguilla anguilla]